MYVGRGEGEGSVSMHTYMVNPNTVGLAATKGIGETMYILIMMVVLTSNLLPILSNLS